MRLFKNRQYSAEQEIVSLYATVNIGASGAVSSSKGGDVASVTKLVGDGNYEIELSSRYQRLLHCSVSINSATSSGVAHVELAEAALQTDFKADSKFKIQCYDYANAAVNPASGSQLMIRIDVRRSSIGPFDL